jgi:hypothetical protein
LASLAALASLSSPAALASLACVRSAERRVRVMDLGTAGLVGAG